MNEKLAQWEKEANTWDETIHSKASPHNHYYKTTALHLISLLKGKSLALETGCGTGDLTIQVASDNNLQIVAIDFSKEMIARARKKLTERKNIHFLVASAEYLPFKEDTFQIAFSRGAIASYVNDLTKFFSEHCRAIKDDGLFCFDFITGRPGGTARFIPQPEIDLALKIADLEPVKIYPMGIFLRKLEKQSNLMDFVNQNIDKFAEIETILADSLKIEDSVMALLIAKRKGASIISYD